MHGTDATAGSVCLGLSPPDKSVLDKALGMLSAGGAQHAESAAATVIASQPAAEQPEPKPKPDGQPEKAWTAVVEDEAGWGEDQDVHSPLSNHAARALLILSWNLRVWRRRLMC